jgi:type I restriction enzyme S subunit
MVMPTVGKGYKQTELGLIPKDWALKKLKDILLSTQLGGNYQNSEDETPYPLIKMGNIGRGKINLNKIEYIKQNITPSEKDKLNYGDVLFNTRNTLELVGKVAVWKDELPLAYYNSNLMRFKFAPDVSNFFMNYVFNSRNMLVQLKSIATGTTSVGAIYTRDLFDVQIPLPELEEQNTIAQVLLDTDELIDLLDKLIEKKKNVKKGAMQELLTGKKRLSGFCEAWEIKEIHKFAEVTAGGTPSTFVPEYWGGNVKWMTSGELNLKKIYDVEGRITELGLRNSAAQMLPSKCVLVGLAGQGKTRGTVAINHVELCTNQSIGAILPNDSFVPEYLYHNLDSRYNELRRLSTGEGGRGGLNLTIIKNILVKLPEREEQLAIAQVLSDIDLEIEALEQKKDKYKQIKLGLMQQLLTGKMRLKCKN